MNKRNSKEQRGIPSNNKEKQGTMNDESGTMNEE